MDKIKEIRDLKNWIQIWIINKEKADGWRRLMQKEFDEIGKIEQVSQEQETK